MSDSQQQEQRQTREYDTTRLTHLLLRAVGWTPVDEGDYELVKAPEGTTFPDRVRFVSEGCALIVDADQVVAHKYASTAPPHAHLNHLTSPQPPNTFKPFFTRPQPPTLGEAGDLTKTCRQAALHYYKKPERTCAYEKEWVEGRNEEALAVDPDVLELAEHLAAFAATVRAQVTVLHTPERDFVNGNPPKAERRNTAPVPTPPAPHTECVRNYTHDCRCPKHRGAPAHDTRGWNPNEDR